jgi:GNAT superfamily N-acetyltransferase
MRILTYDELSPRMQFERKLVNMASLGGIFSDREVGVVRNLWKCSSEYVAVFAVEKERVLGHIFVLRMPYTFRDGAEPIGCIAAVGTRPDVGRSGIARALLEDVLRREKEAGIRYTALWTNRSWGAHALYEKLGYRDVYSSPWVVRVPEERRRKTRVAGGVTVGRKEDLAEIDELHRRQAAGRIGYCYRPKGFSRGSAQLGFLDPGKNLLVARKKGVLVGYAHVDRNIFRTICGELVAESSLTARTLCAEIVRRYGKDPVAFQHTWVTDRARLFASAGYARIPIGWYVMLGQAIGRTWSQREAVQQFATDDPRFICLAGDRF